MKTLFSDPIHWTASAVGTRLRFILLAMVLSAYTGWGFWQAAHEGPRAVLGIGLFVIALQLMLLYALRALYLRVAGLDGGARGAEPGA